MSSVASFDGADRNSRPKIGAIRGLIPFIRPHISLLLATLVALILAAALTLAVPMAFRRMIDHGFVAESAQFIDSYFLMLIVLAALLAVATAARYFFVTLLGERVVTDIRKAVYDHITTLSPAFFETARTGEVLSRLTTDTTVIQGVVGASASVALRNILLFAGALSMMVVTSGKLTLLVLGIVVLCVVPLIIMIARKVRRLSRIAQDKLAETSAYAEETLNAVQTMQAFTHEDIDRRTYASTAEDSYLAAYDRVQAGSWLRIVIIFLVFAGVVGVLWMGARDVLSGRMSGGELAQFVLYSVFVAGSVGALSEAWGDLQRAAGATERLLELLDEKPQIVPPANPLPLPEPAVGAVTFDDVTFRYPTRGDRNALDGFSLSVAPGETVALVGPSGAGKSTVFQLLMRFYDAQSGRVDIDGVDVRMADPQAVRGRLSIVPQETVIFGADALTNIRYGRPDANGEEVIEAAKAAAAHDFIAALPDGYNTHLGEKGVTLSGGQRQRIAIARAILRDAPILLLDEATSSLDADSERAVQEALERLMKNRTTIVIAHRLATVLRADRIIVMDDGRVVEEGTHESLKRGGGLYGRLAHLQFDQHAA